MRSPKLVFWFAALLATVLLAGVVSSWASSSPDGLEKVAADHGIADHETRHGSQDSPMADYTTRGVEDPWLSGATAGIAGVAVCFALAGGVGLAVRRRSGRQDDPRRTGTRS